MTINTENLVSSTEANQNFTRVARMADTKGPAVILKNNVPAQAPSPGLPGANQSSSLCKSAP